MMPRRSARLRHGIKVGDIIDRNHPVRNRADNIQDQEGDLTLLALRLHLILYRVAFPTRVILLTGTQSSTRSSTPDEPELLLPAYLAEKPCSDQRRNYFRNLATTRLTSRIQCSAGERQGRTEKMRKTIATLAKHEDTLQTILAYADGDKEYDVLKVTYSTATMTHVARMGVLIHDPTTSKELVRVLKEADVANVYSYPDYANTQTQTYAELFSMKDGVLEMLSIDETHARSRITAILMIIVKDIHDTELIAIGNEIRVGYSGKGGDGPIEIRHVVENKVLMLQKTMNCPNLVDSMESLGESINNILKLQDVIISFDPLALEAKGMAERFPYDDGELVTRGSEIVRSAFVGIPPENSDASDGDHDNYPSQPRRLISIPFLGKSMTSLAESESSLLPLQLRARNPIHWIDAYEQIEFLSPEEYIDAAPLDQLLLAVSASRNCRARYIPLFFLRVKEPSDQEVASFRRLCDPTDNTSSSSLVPILGVVHENNHFYVIVVLPLSDEVHVLGKESRDLNRQRVSQSDWTYWKAYLGGIGLYLGLDLSTYRVKHTDWPQNGVDCGPMACQVVIHILMNGFVRNSKGFWFVPTFACGHSMRLAMAQEVSEKTLETIEQFSTSLNQDRLSLERLYESDLEDIELRVNNYHHKPETAQAVISKLKSEARSCQACSIPQSALRDAKHRMISEGSWEEMKDRKRVEDHLFLDLPLDLPLPDYDGESTEDDDISSDEVERRDPRTSSQYFTGLRNPGLEEQAGLNASRNGDLPSITDGKAQNEQAPSPVVTNRSDSSLSDKRSRILEKPVKPQQKRNFKKHLPQVIAQCLGIHAKIDSSFQRRDVIKFCISSSNDWLFGLLHCSGDNRECHVTETFTIRSEDDVRTMVFVLTTWIIVPGTELLEHFPKKSRTEFATQQSRTRKDRS
ncbi:hypothetical protein NP233_g10103 [Leucocoprinus birnbaumii]|uniref:Uncharacterized protein n=1 Tax=Leucocoprinus birnbaumii TaxID=56174 RepID=A0AAD5YMG7_9AGAR|nr:hypothetical protein NP233_g10103 [Leucocoprinus birnbaumii]